MKIITTNLINPDMPLSMSKSATNVAGLDALPRWAADGVREKLKTGMPLNEAVAFMARSPFFEKSWVEALKAS